MRCELGKCLCCDKNVMSACSECGAKRPNGQYTEVFVNLSNGSRMALAVCVDCKDDVFTKDRKELMGAVREGWSREHDKMNWDKAKRAAYWEKFGEGVLEIVD